MLCSKKLCAVAAAAAIALCGCSSSDSSKAGKETTASAAAETSSSAASSAPETKPPAGTETAPPPETTEAVTEEPPEENPVVIVEDKLKMLADSLPDRELDNKDVLVFSKADRSEENKQALELFKEKYGGSVSWKTASESDCFGELTALVLAGDPPDLFPIEDADAFPKGAYLRVFSGVDELLAESFGLDRADDTLSELTAYADRRCGIVTDALPQGLLVYNKDTIVDLGLDDPYELFLSGSWTRDNFSEMCRAFKDSGRSYAVGGDMLATLLSSTGGVPLISSESGMMISNIDDKDLAAAQEWMYSFGQKGYCIPAAEEALLSGDALKNGELLFLAVPTDILCSEAVKGFGDAEGGRVMFVPQPSADSSGSIRFAAQLRGYYFCTGAKNPEGATAFASCSKAAAELVFEDSLNALRDQGWAEKMISTFSVMHGQAGQSPVVDLSKGLPSTSAEKIYETVSASLPLNGPAVRWEDTVGQVRKQLDYAVRTANDPEPVGP